MKFLEEIQKNKAAHKAAFESINPSILLSVGDLIVKPLAFIYNLSLNKGIFPEKLKEARVIPIFKQGDPLAPSNYRPISLLSIFDKIFEKLMCKRLQAFWSKYNIFYQTSVWVQRTPFHNTCFN